MTKQHHKSKRIKRHITNGRVNKAMEWLTSRAMDSEQLDKLLKIPCSATKSQLGYLRG